MSRHSLAPVGMKADAIPNAVTPALQCTEDMGEGECEIREVPG